MRKGFYITAAEMSEAGIRVSNEISDHTRFVPPSMKAFFDRARTVARYREDHVVDGKYASETGDTYLANACRRVVTDIDEVVAVWKARWRAAR